MCSPLPLSSVTDSLDSPTYRTPFTPTRGRGWRQPGRFHVGLWGLRAGRDKRSRKDSRCSCSAGELPYRRSQIRVPLRSICILNPVLILMPFKGNVVRRKASPHPPNAQARGIPGITSLLKHSASVIYPPLWEREWPSCGAARRRERQRRTVAGVRLLTAASPSRHNEALTEAADRPEYDSSLWPLTSRQLAVFDARTRRSALEESFWWKFVGDSTSSITGFTCKRAIVVKLCDTRSAQSSWSRTVEEDWLEFYVSLEINRREAPH